MEQIPITTEYIRLDSFLKLTGMVDTGGQAKVIIQDGQVKVIGEVCPMRGKQLCPGDKVSLGDREFQTVQAG